MKRSDSNRLFAKTSNSPISVAEPVLNVTNVITEHRSNTDGGVLDKNRRGGGGGGLSRSTSLYDLNQSLHNYDIQSIRSNLTVLTQNNLTKELMDSMCIDNLSLNDYSQNNLKDQKSIWSNNKMALQFDEDIQESDINDRLLSNSSGSRRYNNNDHYRSAEPSTSIHRDMADLFLKLPRLDTHATSFNSRSTTKYLDKNFMILTSAGKPIFSMKHDMYMDTDSELGGSSSSGGGDDDNDELYGMSGLISTIVEFFKIQGDSTLKSYKIANPISGKICKFVFLDKSPVVLMAYTELEYETELHLLDQLDFIYSYLLSTLSKNKLDRLFNNRENFDLRSFLTDSDFNNLIELCKSICFQFNPQFLFCQSSSLQIFPLKKNFREKLHTLMLSNYTKSLTFGMPDEVAQRKPVQQQQQQQQQQTLLYGMIVSFPAAQLVSILRPKTHSLHTTDLHLLFQLIKSQHYYNKNAGSKDRDSSKPIFEPICFPKFNSNGFLYCFVQFFQNDLFSKNSIDSNNDSDFAMILICGQKTALPYCQHLNDLIQRDISNMTQKGHSMLNSLFPTTTTNQARTNQRNRIYNQTSNDKQNSAVALIQLPRLPNVYHFIYKSKPLVQHITPQITENLMHHYLFLQSQIVNTEQQPLNKKTSLVALKIKLDSTNGNGHDNNQMFIMGICWITSKFELYLLGNPNYNNKKELLASSKKIIHWCYTNEQRIFIKDGAVF